MKTFGEPGFRVIYAINRWKLAIHTRCSEHTGRIRGFRRLVAILCLSLRAISHTSSVFDVHARPLMTAIMDVLYARIKLAYSTRCSDVTVVRFLYDTILRYDISLNIYSALKS